MREMLRPRRNNRTSSQTSSGSSDSSSLLTSSGWNDIVELCNLALPTVILQSSFVVPAFLAASYVGRIFGYVALDGLSLALGTGNLSTLALLQGIFNACDTLAPRAYGAHQYREVGLVAIRGFVASLLAIVAIHAVVIVFLNRILLSLDQDPEATTLACQFYALYATSYPFYALYEILGKFLSAQNALAPMVVSTLACTTIVLPVCMSFFIDYIGFVGVAIAITFFYFFECFMVISWLWWYQPHHPDSWPDLKAWGEALHWRPFLSFLALGTGGMLAYMEWVYWEVLTVIIGALGVMPLSAHTIPRQFTDIGHVIPLGISIALAIRMGAVLSKGDVAGAKALAHRTYMLSFFVFGIASVYMYIYQDLIVQMFTTDESVIELCNEIWLDSCLYCFLFSMYGINSGIAIGLGMQFTFGVVTTICIWLIGIPATYYFAVEREGGLAAVWSTIWPPYVLVNVWMAIAFIYKDWGENTVQIQHQQQQDGSRKRDEGDIECSSLLQ
ncbi:hypothetical protein ACA910_003891 [Epithemia clementina (nom. ined.)]